MQRNFSFSTRLIIDVTIGLVFDTHHHFKPNTLQNVANSKCIKYAEHYERQRLPNIQIPIVANSLGQFGVDTLQFLWDLTDHQAHNTFGFSIDWPVKDAFPAFSPINSTGKLLHAPSRPQIPRKSSPTLHLCFRRCSNSDHWLEPLDVQSDLFLKTKF